MDLPYKTSQWTSPTRPVNGPTLQDQSMDLDLASPPRPVNGPTLQDQSMNELTLQDQ